MNLFTVKDVKLLFERKEDTCISIYMSTHRGGHEVLEGQDRKEFKNNLKKVENELKNKGQDEVQIDRVTGQARMLLEDTEFWRHQSDGLAVFMANGFFKYYSVPLAFDSRCLIMDRFYLKPMMPMLTGEGRFLILSISQKQVKLYEATRESLAEVYIGDIVPESFGEVIGEQVDHQPSMQHRRVQKYEDQGAVFHGHGGSKDLKPNELEVFFRGIDEGFEAYFEEDRPPMLIAGVESFVAEFRKHFHYPNVIDEIIEGNPDFVNPVLLHEKGWDIMSPYFKAQQERAIGKYMDVSGTGKASVDIGDITVSARAGRVDSLFISKDAEMWGEFNEEKGETTVRDEYKEGYICLLNHAAIHTVLNRGDVYLLEEGVMDDVDRHKMTALYRYP